MFSRIRKAAVICNIKKTLLERIKPYLFGVSYVKYRDVCKFIPITRIKATYFGTNLCPKNSCRRVPESKGKITLPCTKDISLGITVLKILITNMGNCRRLTSLWKKANYCSNTVVNYQYRSLQ